MKILNNSSFLAALVLGPAVLVSSIGWGQTVDYFTDNGFANPLSTLQHPTAAYYKGTTYIAYQGPHMDAYVCAYNHASGKWSGPVLAGVSLMAKVSEPADLSEADSHGKHNKQTRYPTPAPVADTLA